MSYDAMKQMPFWDWHRLQAFPVETHVDAPPVREALGYGQMLTYKVWALTVQVSVISENDCEFASVAGGRAPCLVRWVAIFCDSGCSSDNPLSLSR